MLELYKNIKRRRLELEMTQSDLAKKLGYSDKSMIAKIEKGIVDLSQSKITAFAQALQTSEASLMGWEEQPAAAPSSDGRGENKGFSADKPLHQDADNGINGDKPLHVDESKSFYDTDRLLAEVRKYGTDTPEQRAALSAALDSMPIPDDKRELMKGVLELDPDQAAAFLAFAKTVVKRP